MAEDPTDPQFSRQAIESSQVLDPEYVDLDLDCENGDYGALIRCLRLALANHNDPTTAHGIPVLPKKLVGAPKRCMRIRLFINENAVTLLTRDDDLYLIGFELEPKDEKTKKKKVYELGIQVINPNTGTEVSVHMLRGSTFLGCKENYHDLLGREVIVNFPRLRMGKEFAKEAVRSLSTYGLQPARPIGETKEALAGLAFMICEGARMVPHHDMVFVAWALNQKTPITQRHVYCLWAWGALSRLLVAGKAWNRQIKNLIDVQIEDRDVEEAVKYVRLVRHSKPPAAGAGQANDPQPPPGGAPGKGKASKDQPTEPPGGGGAPGRKGQSEQGNKGKASKQGQTSGQSSSSRDVGQRGRPLVEVFSVSTKFPNVGTITIFDGRRGQIIFEGDQGQTVGSQSQGVLRDLALTGPYTAISAEEERIGITVEPYSEEGKRLWEWECPIPEAASTPVMKSYITPVGNDERRITVSYAVLSDAVEAIVQVELVMTGKGEAASDPIDVYGEITASNDPSMSGSVVLLRREQAKKQRVVCGSPISLPLDRSVLAAAVDLDMVISWKLHASWPNHETTIVPIPGEKRFTPPFSHDEVFAVKIVSPEFHSIPELC